MRYIQAQKGGVLDRAELPRHPREAVNPRPANLGADDGTRTRSLHLGMVAF